MYGSHGCEFSAGFVIGTRIHCFVQSHVWTLKCRYLRNLQIICWLLLVTSHTVLNSKNVVRRILVETSHAWCLCISSVFASRPNLGCHTTPIHMFFTDWWHNHPVTSIEVCVGCVRVLLSGCAATARPGRQADPSAVQTTSWVVQTRFQGINGA
jgi:hypothetical protein